MCPANHVVFPWRQRTSRRMVSLLDSYPSLIIINNSICGILHEYIVYISYVIDASRGVPKVITDRTHTPPISEKS